MALVRDLMNSFILERVIWEFTWSITNNPTLLEFDSEYITEKYRNIFLDPKFIVDDVSNVLLETPFHEVNIVEIYKKFFTDDRSSISQKKLNNFQRLFPRSQDYMDPRLYQTPEDIQSLIKEKGKLHNKCLISIKNQSLLFDCNYEQLTLILEILERSIEFYPLTMSNNKPTYSNQSILPNFATHSYLFSFNLGSDLIELLSEIKNETQSNSGTSNFFLNIISEEISNLELPLQNRLKQLKFSSLRGYNGIYVTMKSNSKTSQSAKSGEDRIIFYVSEKFTGNSLVLDRTAIMKSSLVLLNYVLSTYSKHSKRLDNSKIDQILNDISVYITTE